MASLFAFRNHAGTIVVYPKTDPLPIPDITPDRVTNKSKCIRAYDLDSLVLVSGANVYYDFGVHTSDIVLDLNFPEVTPSERTTLRALYNANQEVYFYHAVYGVWYECMWADLKFLVYEGTRGDSTGVYSCRARLEVINTHSF